MCTNNQSPCPFSKAKILRDQPYHEVNATNYTLKYREHEVPLRGKGKPSWLGSMAERKL